MNTPVVAVTILQRQNVRGGSGGSSVTTEYQAILDRATALGYTKPSAAQQIKQNALIVALKSAGIWDLLDVFYVYATDGDQNFATLNWKAPSSFQATLVNGPVFTQNVGFTGNGTNRYINHNWNPATNGVNYTLNNSSVFTYANLSLAASGTFLIGSNNGVAFIGLRGRAAGDVATALNNSAGGTSSASTDSKGFWHGLRSSNLAAGHKMFKNGAEYTASGAVSSAIPSQSLISLGTNNNGTPGSFSANQLGCVGAGASLATRELALYTAWNNYFTSL